MISLDGAMVSIISVTVLLSLWYILKYIEELKDQVEDSNWKINKLTCELYHMRTCIGEYMDTFMYVGLEGLDNNETEEIAAENNEEEVKADELQLG